jgi:phosphoglycolate phosphatase-like HAD superfamily hydrolase
LLLATGQHSRDQLEASGPDFLFDDLADVDRVTSAVLRVSG